MSVVSCGSEDTPADDTDQSTTTTTTAETTLVKEPDFPDVTFDNEEILFLTESRNDIYDCREIYAESETG